MISRSSKITLVCCTLFLGFLFFLIQEKKLIIHFSWNKQQAIIDNNTSGERSRKTITLYINNYGNLEKMNVEILWHNRNMEENFINLIKQWISVLQDEKIIPRYIKLEHATISPITQEGIISFSHSPLDETWPIIQKWYCIESLCKTLKTALIQVESLILLVNNQPIEDDHLDCSQPWPLDGFISEPEK